MSRRVVVLILVVFASTRLLGAWLADHPERYGPRDTKVTGDAELYRFWGNALAHGATPYSEVPIEYPPGALPFVVAPALWGPGDSGYRTGFIALMVVVDAAGLAGLMAIARRRGSFLGALLWIALVPLVGPLAYLRLDLVPAVATIWSLERAGRGSWLGCGGWLGFGALAKLYPALLLVPTWIVSRGRERVLAAAGAVLLVSLVPLLGVSGDLWHRVIGYHAGRGLQVESTWGLGLLVAARNGYPVSIGYNFGAFHVAADAAPALELVSLGLSLGALGVASLLTLRFVARGDSASLAGALLATLAGVMSVGTVLSPQFMLWLAALGAAALSFKRARAIVPAFLLVPAAVLSQALYPFLYNHLLRAETLPLVLLGVRNAALVALAVGTWVSLARSGAPETRLSAGRAGSGTS